jgi:hypothetical protein
MNTPKTRSGEHPAVVEYRKKLDSIEAEQADADALLADVTKTKESMQPAPQQEGSE